MDFFKMFRYPFIGKVKAEDADVADEEDLIDPQEVLRTECGATLKIAGLWDTYQECNVRVNSKTKTQETCEQELFDYVEALDHCVAKTLFSKLK